MLIPKKFEIPSEERMIEIATEWWKDLEYVAFTAYSEKLKEVTIPFHILPPNKELAKRITETCDSQKNYCHTLPLFYDYVEPAFEQLGLKIHNKFFMKLISRSPKDYLSDDEGICRPIRSVHDALTSLISSLRTFDDLVLLSHLDIPFLVIRPWVNLDPNNEWRVLIRDGEIAGISFYYYNLPVPDFTPGTLVIIDQTIRDFINLKVIPEMKINSFVADVVFIDNELKLIETNPYGMSDPCFFESYDNLDGTIRVCPISH